MNCWNMLVVAFALIAWATAFKVCELEPEVKIIVPIIVTMTLMVLVISMMMMIVQ